MKAESDNKKLFYKILIIVGIVLLTVALMYSFKTDFPYALASGAIGAVLTVVVTMLLLIKQSDTEEIKDRNSKIFEKKLEVYHDFIAALEEIIQDRRITLGEKDDEKDELASLLFQLARLRMHTEENSVLEILKKVADINSSLSDNNENRSADHEHLAKSLFPIVNILRDELYPKSGDAKYSKKDTKSSSESEIDKGYLDYIRKIIIGAKDSSGEIYSDNKKGFADNTEPFDDLEREKHVKAFEGKLVNSLKEHFRGDEWILVCESKTKFNIDIQNKSKWPDGSSIGIFDYDEDRMHFAAIYKGHGNYKDVYLNLRRELGGRYNRYNWWIDLKDPYNKWDETSLGIDAVKNKDEFFINYLVSTAVQIEKTFNNIYQNVGKQIV